MSKKEYLFVDLLLRVGSMLVVAVALITALIGGNVFFGNGPFLVEAATGTGAVLDSDLHSGRTYFHVTVDDDIAYIAQGTSGIELVDISNENDIKEKDTLNTDDEARDIAVDADCAYVADLGGGIVGVDVSSPTDITEEDTEITNQDAEGIFLDTDNDIVYVAIGNEGIAAYEVDPDTCKIGTELTDAFDVGGDAHDLVVVDDVAYVAADSQGLVAVDVSDPEDMAIEDTFQTDGDALSVFVDGNTAYVAQNDSGFVSIDISDPSDLLRQDDFNTSDDALDIYVEDEIAYIALAGGDGIVSFDVSDPEELTEEDDTNLGLSSSDDATGIFVTGNVISLAVDGKGFYTVDATDLGGSGSSNSGDGFPDIRDGDLFVDETSTVSPEDGTIDAPFTSIQEAIDAAESGDQITVFPGTYAEDLEIDQNEDGDDLEDISLIGVGPTFTTIEGEIDILQDGVTIQGFTIRDGSFGIHLDNVNDFLIKNNVFVSNDDGIHVEKAKGDIINNTFSDNDGNGIMIDAITTTNDLVIKNNIIASSNETGLYLKSGTGAGITDTYNLFYDNSTVNISSGLGTPGSDTILNQDPKFVDDSDDEFTDISDRNDWEEDFYLESNSPAVNKGDTAILDPDDSRSDMGAFGGPEAEADDDDDPDEPEGLAAVLDSSTVTLTWDDNNDERDLYGYYVFRSSTSATTDFTQLTDTPIIGNTYEDVLLAGGTYYYTISAVDFYEGESDKATAVSITTGDITPIGFADAATFNEFAVFINKLASQLIISGYPDNTFRPYNNVTRAELLKMALGGAAVDTTSFASQASTFSDVPSNHSLKQYINYASTNGIVSGQSGKFRPNDPVTRFEATKIVLKSFNMPATGTSSTFIDVVLPEMIQYIEAAKAQGILSGIGNRFFPNNNLTRAEAAKIISNTMDR